MQPVTAAPRSLLRTADVLSLLTSSPSVQIQGGVEQYNSTLGFVADLSGYLQEGSSVSSDVTADIHRSCSLVMDSNTPFNYLSDFLKPYVVMTDNTTGYSARFNLGVYSMVSPTPDLSLAPGQSEYTGYDLLQMLAQPIGDTLEVPAGSDPVFVAKTLGTLAFPPATFITVATATTTQALSFPLDSSNQWTYLDAINATLASVGYAPLWVDWDGNFRVAPYVDPNDPTIPAEWTFDLTSATGSVMNESRSVFQDLYNIPNVWVSVMNNLTAAPVEGTTKFTFTDNWSFATSVTARKRTIKKIQFLDAADYPSLVVAAAQVIGQDLLSAESFAVLAYPIPLFWHRDIVTYKDPVLGTLGPYYVAQRQTMVRSWTLPLDQAGGDMGLTLVSTSPATTKALGH